MVENAAIAKHTASGASYKDVVSKYGSASLLYQQLDLAMIVLLPALAPRAFAWLFDVPLFNTLPYMIIVGFGVFASIFSGAVVTSWLMTNRPRMRCAYAKRYGFKTGRSLDSNWLKSGRFSQEGMGAWTDHRSDLAAGFLSVIGVLLVNTPMMTNTENLTGISAVSISATVQSVFMIPAALLFIWIGFTGVRSLFSR